jgi:hypothetical protein
MNRTNRLIFSLLAMISFSVLISCKKHIDPEDYEDLGLCNIKRVLIYKSGYTDTADFIYNAHGNPKAINVTNVATGNPRYVFTYDHGHRLKEFISLFDNGSFNTWSKYYYAGGRIVKDSSFTFGAYNGGAYPSDYYYQYVNYYEYDAAGRVSKVTSEFSLPAGTPTAINTYNYDASGNRIIAGVVYDDKINFRRTNKIWKFVDRDYSRNNPMTATSYNAVGLPLSFNTPGYPHYFLTFEINRSDFFYSCKYGGYTLP